MVEVGDDWAFNAVVDALRLEKTFFAHDAHEADAMLDNRQAGGEFEVVDATGRLYRLRNGVRVEIKSQRQKFFTDASFVEQWREIWV